MLGACGRQGPQACVTAARALQLNARSVSPMQAPMRDIVRSFGIGYLAVPLPFYFVDGVGHLRPLTVWFPYGLTIALVVTTVVIVSLLRHWRARLRIRAPLAMSLGGTLGLLHWFPLYMTFGRLFLWKPVGQLALLDSLKFLGLTFVVPIISLSGATYDGSVFGILASMALLVAVGLAWRIQQAIIAGRAR